MCLQNNVYDKSKTIYGRAVTKPSVTNRFGVLSVALLVLSGCHPSGNQYLEISHRLVMNAQAELQSEQEQFFTSRQIEVLLGKSEKVISAQDFFVILGKSEPSMANTFRETLMERLSVYLHRSQQAESQARYNPKTTEIEKCRIWLYNWSVPIEVRLAVVGGTVAFPSVRHITEKWSHAYVIYDSRMIHSCHIKRSQ